MWNQSNAQNTSTPATKPPLTNGPAAAMSESPLVRTSLAASASAEQAATIGKSLVVKGEVTGSESLYIDGKVEGTINLPGNRVTVGRNGQVAANITAREIVVQGRIVGNVTASDRLDVRSEGSLTGDVVAQRISVEDGAFFKGKIDIRRPAEKAGPSSEPKETTASEESSAKIA
ncbi:MAG: cell shape determination protein CcmA [Acidobacteria bacterium]|nr:MAG: cell shape determination protein CcmA [Acidobacteriota bacterium]